MWRARFALLLGALCCALVACSSTSRPTVWSLSGVSGVASPRVATSSEGPASGLPCGGDRDSGQVVAVYRAMLGEPILPDARAATRLYVWTTLTDGAGLGTSAGIMSDAVKSCLSAGVAGLPPISLVDRRDDPAIPTASQAGEIRTFVGDVAFVSFGDVVLDGSKATSSVTVDKGGGAVAAGEYVLKVGDSGATVVSTTMNWIS